MGMHRLFIAVDLPEEARQAVCGRKGEMAGSRWVPEEQLHLTLRFIGDADDALLERIGQELVKVRPASFDLSLVGTGHFPPRGLPRVLWAGIETSPALSDLQATVET